jgi:alkyldihydroxyacetonephosphate synthase
MNARRWNGWGFTSKDYPLPVSARPFLESRLGPFQPQVDAPIASLLKAVPESRLPDHPLIHKDPELRLLHARGQSLPDWLALRYGRVNTFPDGVALPTSQDQIQVLLDLASDHGWQIIPYGGGTSVVGHINPVPGARPVLTVSMAKLTRMISLDETSRLAEFEAGVPGPLLESQLAARGYTLGHFPQSFEFSTVGGWIATRSSGQQSYYYGRIEDLFAGGTVIAPGGILELPPLPASAAGPDLRHLVLGSEGHLGLVTRAILRVRSLPAAEGFFGVFFKDWLSGVAAVRALAQSDLPLSMLRLSNPQETETTLVLSGKEKLVGYADRGLSFLGYRGERCLLIFGVTGSASEVARTRRAVGSLCRSFGGLPVGAIVGKTWKKSRFLTPYLRNTLWEQGYAIDTLETALPWTQVIGAADAIQDSIRRAASQAGEPVLVFAHLSHFYPDGASIYVTYLFRLNPDPETTLANWIEMKTAASKEIVRFHGTISHQHGVGLDHAPYLAHEKSTPGIMVLQAAFGALDPGGLCNPGKLLSRSQTGFGGEYGLGS